MELFRGIPWNLMSESSMEIDGELSIEFYGTFPCNYMEIEVLILHKIQGRYFTWVARWLR